MQSIFRFTVASLLLLTLARSGVLFYLLDISSYSIKDIATLYYMGLRFDLKIIAGLLLVFYWLPTFVLLLISKQQALIFKTFHQLLLLVFLLLTLITFIGFGFYLHFGSAIDPLIFGLWEDGFRAVFLSGFDQLWALGLALGFVFLAGWAVWWDRRYPAVVNQTIKTRKIIVVWLILFVILALFSRGSFGTFPLSKETNNANPQPELNNLALNSVMDLYYAYQHHQLDILSFSTQDILSQAKVDNLEKLKKLAGFDANNPLLKKINHPNISQPNIIFVLMEGWSSHIALSHSPSNNVLGDFAQHAKADYFANKIFSNSYGTNPSLERLLFNSPITPLSHSNIGNTQLQTASIKPFKTSGYHTKFISGGSREWRNIGNFYRQQGFDEFFDRSNIESYTKRIANNPWGAYEEDLFSFAKHKLKQQDSPSFSFILTTNNHPPVMLPQNYQSPNFDLALFNGNNETKKMLDGFYYQTHAFGQFMTWLKNSNFATNTIVVATGDHILKGFVNYNSPKMAYYRYAVPLYFYIPKQYKQLKNTEIAGSHLDIFPTLYELSLASATYFSFGQSLFKKQQQTAYGWHQGYYGLFAQGVSNNTQLHTWQANNSLLLNPEPQPPIQTQTKILKQLFFQEMLAKYLIIQSIE